MLRRLQVSSAVPTGLLDANGVSMLPLIGFGVDMSHSRKDDLLNQYLRATSFAVSIQELRDNNRTCLRLTLCARPTPMMKECTDCKINFIASFWTEKACVSVADSATSVTIVPEDIKISVVQSHLRFSEA